MPGPVRFDTTRHPRCFDANCTDARARLRILGLAHDAEQAVVEPAALRPGDLFDPFAQAHAIHLQRAMMAERVVARPPEQRLRDEREQLGIDHALVGGVLARRWNLPQRLAVAIERHHAEDADGLAAMVSAADMVAHYTNGEAISPERLTAS